MSHDDPPLSMVVANLRVSLRNFCEFGTERLNDPDESVWPPNELCPNRVTDI